eukprot:TRINITY_DN105952_c0_g1_i1.p1 TRINITY_DN105952_c0_g1~~TRINITY_DN105952_c0_g1_i1.p1  ORF type:complete len:257 (-),score=56.89 TRINITY_DN105952_c0_g1_i1:171-941(-)
MAWLRPAERCCCRPLQEGVKVISTYTVLMGLFGVMSFFVDHDFGAHGSAFVVAMTLQQFLNVFGLYAGFKGLMGNVWRDPRRLRVLLFYHVLQILAHFVMIGAEEMEACRMLAYWKQRRHELDNVTCGEVEQQLVFDLVLRTSFLVYCAYIIWSLVARLEAGESFTVEDELADIIASDLHDRLVAHQMLTPRQTPRRTPGQTRPTSGPPPGLTPFSGAPRRLPGESQVDGEALEEGIAMVEQGPQEPFTGTPHRLG